MCYVFMLSWARLKSATGHQGFYTGVWKFVGEWSHPIVDATPCLLRGNGDLGWQWSQLQLKGSYEVMSYPPSPIIWLLQDQPAGQSRS